MKKALINKEVKHQGIGGKEIIIEQELSVAYFLDANFKDYTIAMYNFVMRRTDLMEPKYENVKVYYGHVGFLGYFVSEDEIKWSND